MGISHRQLEAFQTFMETGTVTASAERLHVSQPAISNLLINLEQDLALKLFTRSKKRLVPTNEAHLLYMEVKRLFTSLGDIETFAKDLRHLRTGELRIASATSLGHTVLADAIADFAKQHGKARIVFTVTSSIDQLVVNQQVELGFSVVRVQHPSLITEPIMRARAVCALPINHRLAEQETVRAEDLKDEQFISYMRDSRMRHLTDAVFEQRRISRQMQYEVLSSAEACAFVERGLGVSIIEPFGVGYRQPAGIAVRHFEPTMEFIFYVMRNRYRETSRLAAAFLESLNNLIQQLQEDVAHSGQKISLKLPRDTEDW